MTSTDPATPISNTCANCFAEFEWIPFAQDGEEFCCSGCADGGPCICTYNGAPHLTQDEPEVVASGEQPSQEEPSELEETLPAASAEGGAPPETPEPPAPAEHPDDGEPPTNGRLAIIMSAISEMPLPVQEVVRARLASSASDDDIGQPLGLDGDEVRQLIRQGQAILDRSIGSTFRIRYIGAEEVAGDEATEPEFPDFETEDTDPPATATPVAASDEARTELRDLIARSFSTLADASTGEGLESQQSRNVLAETLREVGNLLRIASERLVADEPSDMSLREALADRRGSDEPVTVIVENRPDITPFFIALQGHESVLWSKLRSVAPQRAEFSLMISSMMSFVRDMMTMEGSLRPTRLQMSENEITVELPHEEGAAEMAQEPAVATSTNGTNGKKPGPRFEMSVDSFFGARHFIESSSSAPHHHSYRVEATFVTSEPDRTGFALGFANVREMVDSTVLMYSETLLNTEDPFREIPPTTENLARVFHEQVSARLRQLNVPSVGLSRVRVWESPTNSASYSDAGADSGTHAATAS